MNIIKCTLASFAILSLSLNIQAQYRYPLDIPASLSANFAELRPNHFHGGIDLKTENAINKPVYSIEAGYVSRINISHSGYGLAIYVNHPDGNISVYAHLNKFAPKIQEYVKEKQYELEKYNIDLVLDDKQFPVKKGQLIAYSGNTGSSFGPHVHFEIRKNNGEEPIDPLPYFRNEIADTQKPIIKGITIFPIENEGVANFGDTPIRRHVPLSKNGDPLPLKDTISVWGKIGIGINSIDKMNGTSNIYGVKKVRLYVDEKEIFYSEINSFRFDQSRMINSLTDFDFWSRVKIFEMKSYVEPGNKLPIYKTVNNGYLTIDKEKLYHLRYELEDLYGNKTSYEFVISGKKQNLIPPAPCSQVMAWDQNNYYITDDFSLSIPKEQLYTNLGFVLKTDQDTSKFSLLYSVHNKFVPLNSYCDMKIKITEDVLANKSQYGIVRITPKGKSWVGGKYSEGHITTGIRELGNKYAISSDIQAPTITPLLPKKWAIQGEIVIKLTDDKSGISSYRGTIDGKYALFTHDSKSSKYIYKFDPERLQKGKTHKLVFTASDACGNEASYEYEFKY